jgi:uncharacterized protein YbbK (DUF523 family)
LDTGRVAIGGDGNVQLEFSKGKEKRTALWERLGGAVLESVFNEEGAVLRQELHPDAPAGGMSRTSELLDGFARREGVEVVGEKGFERVTLKKPCPKCGKQDLNRERPSAGGIRGIRVIPVYVCGGCGSKGYHLTDEYLDFMIENNKGLFDGKEMAEMSRDRGAFASELKEYVIRIFASKRISNIK